MMLGHKKEIFVLWVCLFVLVLAGLPSIYDFWDSAAQVKDVPVLVVDPSPTSTTLVVSTNTPFIKKVVQSIPKVIPLPPLSGSPVATPDTPTTKNTCETMLASSPFYSDKDAQARLVYEDLKKAGDPRSLWIKTLACTPQPIWLSRALTEDITGLVNEKLRRADAEGKTAVVVIYNSPHHGEYAWWSGLSTGAEYANWTEKVSSAIGTSSVWIILEPDVLGLSFEYSPDDRVRVDADIAHAVMIFKKNNPNARVYLDAGHSSWKDATHVASRLLSMGLPNADGFATNISNFRTTEDEVAYAKKLSLLVGGKHFIVDTGRNGNGPSKESEWCNPLGRAIGTFPTTKTGDVLIDAFLWIKNPGESDGSCNGGPGAGKFWVEEAVNMVKNAESLRDKQGIILAE